MPLEGLDYAWGRPSMASLTSGGFKFACRYSSHDTSGKNLDLAEATRLSNAGLWIVVVFEDTAGRITSGFSAGAADAVFASAQMRAAGMPDGRPIYFACDFDAGTADQSSINAYLDGAASQIGRDRVGIYGGFGPVSRAFDAGKIKFAWQTYAWSGGKWDSRAQIQQYHNDIVVGGVGCDRDRAMIENHPDYGQWKIGAVPDMPLNASDANVIWNTDNIVAVPVADPNNPFWTAGYHLTNIGQHVRAAEANASAAKSAADAATTEIHTAKNEILAALAALPIQASNTDAIVAGVLAGLDPQSLADHIASDLGPGVASQVLDALAARLAS